MSKANKELRRSAVTKVIYTKPAKNYHGSWLSGMVQTDLGIWIKMIQQPKRLKHKPNPESFKNTLHREMRRKNREDRKKRLSS